MKELSIYLVQQSTQWPQRDAADLDSQPAVRIWWYFFQQIQFKGKHSNARWFMFGVTNVHAKVVMLLLFGDSNRFL